MSILTAQKRPIKVQALLVQPSYRNLEEIMEFVGKENLCPIERHPGYILKIKTLEGDMSVGYGDYIIKGVNGEFYTCTPDVFEKTYDVAEKKSPSEVINNIIKSSGVTTNEISDGYHTFGELYEHRFTLYIKLCEMIIREAKAMRRTPPFVFKAKQHADGSMYEGWFLLGIDDRQGKQISYHLPLSWWDKTSFAATLDKAPEFDGHTSEDVLERLKTL
jgi:hypothetical protein